MCSRGAEDEHPCLTRLQAMLQHGWWLQLQPDGSAAWPETPSSRETSQGATASCRKWDKTWAKVILWEISKAPGNLPTPIQLWPVEHEVEQKQTPMSQKSPCSLFSCQCFGLSQVFPQFCSSLPRVRWRKVPAEAGSDTEPSPVGGWREEQPAFRSAQQRGMLAVQRRKRGRSLQYK